MANVLKHRFTSAKTDGADGTQVQPSHWNDGHLFTGGTTGDLLTRDSTDASFGAKWAAPPTVPTWTDIPYAASNFSGSGGMIWMVDSADQVTLGYSIIGKMAFISINVVTTSVSGTRDNYLQVNVGVVAFRSVDSVAKIVDSGSQLIGLSRIFAGESLIRFHRVDGTTWNLSTNGTNVYAQFAYPIG